MVSIGQSDSSFSQALNDGDIDVAVLLTEGIVKDIASGGKSKIVSVYVQSPLCWAVLTGSGCPDLKNNHPILRKHLEQVLNFPDSSCGSYLRSILQGKI